MPNQKLFDRFSEKDLQIIKDIWGKDAWLCLSDMEHYVNKNETQDLLREKYLAHWILVLEGVVANEVKNPAFKIILVPDKRFEVASSEYEPKIFFTINYPIQLDGNELNNKNVRVIIAHELGHLFFQIFSKKLDEYYSTKDNESEFREQASTLFAMSILRDKCKFYQSVSSRKVIKYHSTEAIIRDCIQIHKHQSNEISHSS